MNSWRAAGRAAALQLGAGAFCRALAAVFIAASLCGCAELAALRPPPTSQLASDDNALSGPYVSPRVEIVAEPELRILLERYLDLSRLGALSQGLPVSATEWSRLIDVAPAQARELLQTEGYFSPEVRISTEGGSGAVPTKVRLELEPGPRTVVGRVDIEFAGAIERDADAGLEPAVGVRKAVQAAWPLKVGSPFRNAQWAEAKNIALARLRALGYASANWAGTGAEVDPQTQQVRLFLVADSGPLFRLGALQIEGLATHDASLVRNLSTLPTGAPVTESLMLDYQERLLKVGLFENIAVTLDTDPDRAEAATVTVRLRELPLQVWTIGLGITANNGPRAAVEHVYRHVFGLPLTAHNKFDLGKSRQAWDGEISTRADRDLYRNLIGGAVERLVTSNDVVLSQRVRLGRTQDMQRIERLYFAEVERATRSTDAAFSEAIAATLNYHGIWRDLDNILLPTQGYTLSFESGVGYAHSSTAASGPFSRLYGRITGYESLGRNWFGNGRIELGRVFMRQDMEVPDTQRFRAGGDDSVRGYAYRSLGPIVDGAVGSGTNLFTASVEAATPLFKSNPSLWGAVFIDAGAAADSIHDLRPAIGLGTGLRWRSPVGPLRIDLAWGEQVRAFRVHFSVGIAL
jgi:translocation and assembly module TamA